MKSLMLFLKCVLVDSGTRCGISTNRDLKTITARIEQEGMSFLTISLSNYGKDLQKGLDQGFVDHSLFRGFRFRAGLPQLFGGFLDLVFDRTSGVLLDTPSIDAIRCVRQLTLMFAKIKLPCSEERKAAAFTKYVECESDVRMYDASLSEELKLSFTRVSSLLFRDVLAEIDRKVFYGELLPKHGPGSTAERLVGNEKFLNTVWTERLEEYFPEREMLLPNWSFNSELPDTAHLEPGAELPVRVVDVPKTLKTPRIIALEPSYVQFVQQGLLEALTAEIDSDDFGSNLVSWRSQLPNQQLALAGSRDGSLATLDLSEASDRVSNQHVRLMLARFPHLFGAVDACRSRKADVPGHGVIRLAKFASMGSALCFPMESMVFMTIIFMAIESELKIPLTRRTIKQFFGEVRTYGDDIIVPTRFAIAVQRHLEAFGLRVNTDKSYWTGKFRESCGKDYYNGRDVSVAKLRSMFPADRDCAKEVVSTVSLRNQLFELGYVEAVDYLDSLIEKIIPFPVVEKTSSLLGRHSNSPWRAERMHRHLQVPLVRGCAVDSTIPSNSLDGHPALLKFFLKRGVKPFLDEKHLERSGRPSSVRIKTRWSTPY